MRQKKHPRSDFEKVCMNEQQPQMQAQRIKSSRKAQSNQDRVMIQKMHPLRGFLSSAVL